MRIERFENNPIIVPDMDCRMGDNINGPSLIRVPSWVKKPLGKYYLYFGHHKGEYIRMAYADDLRGPWRTYKRGTLSLKKAYFSRHIASPDAHVDEANQQIVMYYHGPAGPEDRARYPDVVANGVLARAQFSRRAVSPDGLRFKADPLMLTPFYLRVFEWQGQTYGYGMPGHIYHRDEQGQFNPGPLLFDDDNQRHAALLLRGSTLHVFYTHVGDVPESILHTTIELEGDWQSWRPGKSEVVLKPEMEWEGANEPAQPSERGAVKGRVNQLRDPCIYEEDGRVYLLYSVAGESGIAIAQIHDL